MERRSVLSALVRSAVVGTAAQVAAAAVEERVGMGQERRLRGRRALGRMTPLGALARGVVAGAVGSAVQTLFFRATRRITPSSPEGVFQPPEEEQREEQATQTVARRFVEDFVQRGPLRDKERGGKIVHEAFGAAWGGVYGLIRGSYPAASTPLGVAAFSTLVWVVSDNVILPVFRLAAWPQAYPLRTHAYAWVAHLVYGAAVAAAFEAQRRSTWAPVAAVVSARWATRRLPAPVRPAAARVLVLARRARAGVGAGDGVGAGAAWSGRLAELPGL